MPSDKALELIIDIDTPEILALLARCVEAEREANCRAVCDWCANSGAARRDQNGNWWHGEYEYGPVCEAGRIRERAHQEKEGSDAMR